MVDTYRGDLRHKIKDEKSKSKNLKYIYLIMTDIKTTVQRKEVVIQKSEVGVNHSYQNQVSKRREFSEGTITV